MSNFPLHGRTTLATDSQEMRMCEKQLEKLRDALFCGVLSSLAVEKRHFALLLDAGI